MLSEIMFVWTNIHESAVCHTDQEMWVLTCTRVQ